MNKATYLAVKLFPSLSLVNSKKYRWNSKKTLVVLISSVIPFGTFYVDYKYLKTDEHRN